MQYTQRVDTIRRAFRQQLSDAITQIHSYYTVSTVQIYLHYYSFGLIFTVIASIACRNLLQLLLCTFKSKICIFPSLVGNFYHVELK